MAVSDLVNFSALLDDDKCFALVRQHRWPEAARRWRGIISRCGCGSCAFT